LQNLEGICLFKKNNYLCGVLVIILRLSTTKTKNLLQNETKDDPRRLSYRIPDS
jgi:hypothetical protein